MRLLIAVCVVSLVLTGCAVRGTPQLQHQYQVYTPSPDSKIRIQFEYPADWHLEEEVNTVELTLLTLCDPWPKEVPTPPGIFTRCADIIHVATYPADADTPNVEAAIALLIKDFQTTPDYVLVRRPITISGRVAQRTEICFTPAGYAIPEPPPVALHTVYFQIGQRIYEIYDKSDPVDSPCDPTAMRFPEFEHLLETLVILEP